MPADPRLRAQIDLIHNAHPDAVVFPEEWERDGDADYIYRANTILVNQRDEVRVVRALTQILGEAGHQFPDLERPFDQMDTVGNVVSITLPPPVPDQAISTVPVILDALDPLVGRGKATPEYLLFVCPHSCPATEPGEVPLGIANPFPPPGSGAGSCPGDRHGHARCGCDGDGVFVSVVDTGLLPGAATDHSWLTGVDGTPEDPYGPDGNIAPYAGHGTFSAGCLRSVAPQASVYVERAFDIAAADYETNLVSSLEDALHRNPDILVFTFTTSTRHDQSLLTFDDFYERRLRHVKGLKVVAPAGNDGKSRWMWPAAYPWVLSVGALSASWRQRAHFSNFGGWVDVYAPGEDLINAFATGTYVCNEPPVGQQRHFNGMALWSGTSFSTPIVAGLIAARMSATGENAQEATESLQRLARRQAIPGVGAVLYPGQACCEPGHADCQR
ncbi:MAG TPA: S8/S53 family peptidase [Streptosporangiaceae bacterium]